MSAGFVISSACRLAFTSRGIYDYAGVPKNVHQRFMAAPSKGRFFDSSIKDKYRTVKVR
jgi:hypothetical protein